MGYDMTIQSDEEFSQFADSTTLREFLAGLEHVVPNGSHNFALDDRPKRWMEIDLEVVASDGCYKQDMTATAREINCIRLHIPYSFYNDPEDYFPTAEEVADFLGWRIYDEQGGDFIYPPSG